MSNIFGSCDPRRRSRYLTGCIPPELGHLDALEVLNLSFGRLSGASCRCSFRFKQQKLPLGAEDTNIPVQAPVHSCVLLVPSVQHLPSNYVEKQTCVTSFRL